MQNGCPCELVLETNPDVIKAFMRPGEVLPYARTALERLRNMSLDELSGKYAPEPLESHKMHFDGTHYVTSKEGEKRGTKRIKKPETQWDKIFTIVYEQGKREGVKPSGIANYIYGYMKDGYCYPDEDPDMKPLRSFIRDKLFNISQAKLGRARRFRYKSGFVRWNYFITITYSDKLISEQDFYKSLKKQFGNLRTRHGWKIAGAFERGKKTNRLHFHGLVHVPDGELMGELKEVKTFDFDEHRMKIIHQNLYFSVRYGRNDFEPIDSSNRSLINKKIGYIQKYIQKSGERMFYSRGIPCHVLMKIKRSDVAVIMTHKIRGVVNNYVLFNDAVGCDDNSSDQRNADTT